MIYLSWGTTGQGRVSILELSRYMRRSKSQMRIEVFSLANENLVDVIEVFSAAGSKKLLVQLSAAGDDFLMSNFDAAIAQYHQHVAETIALINERASEAKYAPRKLTKKQRDAIAAGQKEMF